MMKDHLSVQRLVAAVALVVLVAHGAREFVMPVVADLYYRDRFRELAADCDHAMHDEAAIRSRNDESPTGRRLSASADIQLLTCHEYDKLRKHLLALGVSGDLLALRSLEGLEIEQIPVGRLVAAHRLERF